MSLDPNHPQPAPLTNDRTPTWDLVVTDIATRDELGRKRYGTRLQPFNGRDSLRDSYEEALDLVVYFRSVIEEASALRRDLLDLRNGAERQSDADRITAIVDRYAFLQDPTP